MNEGFMQELVGAWRYGIKPDTEVRKRYNNAKLSFRLPQFDLTIEGLVVWDEKVNEYTFCFRNHRSSVRSLGNQEGFAMYAKEVHQQILDTFRVQFGIFRTNGLYPVPDHSCFFFDRTGKMVC